MLKCSHLRAAYLGLLDSLDLVILVGVKLEASATETAPMSLGGREQGRGGR